MMTQDEMNHGACLIHTGSDMEGCYSLMVTIPCNGTKLGVYLHWHEGKDLQPDVRIRSLEVMKCVPEPGDKGAEEKMDIPAAAVSADFYLSTRTQTLWMLDLDEFYPA